MFLQEPLGFGTFFLFSVLGTAILTVYLLPTILAAFAKEEKLPVIMMLNVCFGWTIIGYVAALALAGQEADPGPRHRVESPV
ncbi:MAG: superinfection immunity protein [Acidobacteriota bacterium]